MPAKNQHIKINCELFTGIRVNEKCEQKLQSKHKSPQNKSTYDKKTQIRQGQYKNNVQSFLHNTSILTQIKSIDKKQSNSFIRELEDTFSQSLQCPYCNNKLILSKVGNNNVSQNNNQQSYKVMLQQLNISQAKNEQLMNYIKKLQFFIRELQISRIQISLKSIQSQQQVSKVPFKNKDINNIKQKNPKLILLQYKDQNLRTEDTKSILIESNQNIFTEPYSKQNQLQKKEPNHLQGKDNQSKGKRKRFNRTSKEKNMKNNEQVTTNNNDQKQIGVQQSQQQEKNQIKNEKQLKPNKMQKTIDQIQKQRKIQLLTQKFMDFMTQFQKERHKSKRKNIVKKIAEIAKQLDFQRNNQQFIH